MTWVGIWVGWRAKEPRFHDWELDLAHQRASNPRNCIYVFTYSVTLCIRHCIRGTMMNKRDKIPSCLPSTGEDRQVIKRSPPRSQSPCETISRQPRITCFELEVWLQSTDAVREVHDISGILCVMLDFIGLAWEGPHHLHYYSSQRHAFIFKCPLYTKCFVGTLYFKKLT